MATHDPVDANLQKLTQLVNKESNLIEKVLARSAHSLLNLMSLEIRVHGQKYVDGQTLFPLYIETCMLIFSAIWIQEHKSCQTLILGDVIFLTVNAPVHPKGVQWGSGLG